MQTDVSPWEKNPEYEGDLPDREKVRIVTKFIKNAPPGEFNEVFNDVRVLLSNDILLKKACPGGATGYNMDQLVPIKVEDDLEMEPLRQSNILELQVKMCQQSHMAEFEVLVTSHGKLDSESTAQITEIPGLTEVTEWFVDPRGRRTFKFDHLRKIVSDIQPYEVDDQAESWRSAIDQAMQPYVKEHYPEGILTVYGLTTASNIKIVACIEDHEFHPRNFWNGRWRSEWSFTFSPGSFGDLCGSINVQVHLYPDGNVQLTTNKDIKKSLKSSNEEETAKEFVKMVESAENEYQSAQIDNYKILSKTILKALRRALPVNRKKVDWQKITAYNKRAN